MRASRSFRYTSRSPIVSLVSLLSGIVLVGLAVVGSGWFAAFWGGAPTLPAGLGKGLA